MEEGGSTLKTLSGAPKRKIGPTFREARRKWEDNISMDLKGIGLSTKNWVVSVQDRDF